MEFRRINALPPYAFVPIDALKMEYRRAGEDVIDLGFGNPDLPSPDTAVAKLIEAARNPRNHRYSMTRGIPKLREALSHLYDRRFNIAIDPETEVCATIGAKEAFSHLMLALLGPGDTALVPAPSYPIHIWGPIIAGAAVQYVRMGPGQDFFTNLHTAWEQSWPRPRVLVISFPHNPTTMCVDLEFMAEVVKFARETRDRGGARLRLRRSRFRRPRPAVDPAGAGRAMSRWRSIRSPRASRWPDGARAFSSATPRLSARSRS